MNTILVVMHGVIETHTSFVLLSNPKDLLLNVIFFKSMSFHVTIATDPL